MRFDDIQGDFGPDITDGHVYDNVWGLTCDAGVAANGVHSRCP